MIKNKRKIFWMILDLLVCVAFGFFNVLYLITAYIGIFLPLLMFCGFAIIWILAGHPYLPQLPRKKKCAYAILRCILYAGALAVSFLPHSMNYDAAWYYPVQRAVVLSGYSPHIWISKGNEIPRYIPSGAEDFQFRFSPQVMQGSSVLEISFFTDSETIAEYRDFAEKHCTKRLSLTLPEGMTDEEFDLDGDPSEWSRDERLIHNWRYYLREDYGQEPDGMVFYQLDYVLYVLSEETGYFLLYD